MYAIRAAKADEDRLALFILRGTTRPTVNIGERERGAVVRDILDLTKTATFPLSDLERLVVGEKPSTRNLRREQQLLPDVKRIFKAITKRSVDVRRSADLPVYESLMYRLRIPRDLAAERVALKRFQKLFGHSPRTPLDWAALRAVQVTAAQR